MASMSYCIFENTSDDLYRILEMLEEANCVESLDLSEYEVPYYKGMKSLCERIIYELDKLEE